MCQHSPQMAHHPQSPPQPSSRSQRGRFQDARPATTPPSAHMQHACGPSPPPPISLRQPLVALSRHIPARVWRQRRVDVSRGRVRR
jgi:hypothetical protein